MKLTESMYTNESAVQSRSDFVDVIQSIQTRDVAFFQYLVENMSTRATRSEGKNSILSCCRRMINLINEHSHPEDAFQMSNIVVGQMISKQVPCNSDIFIEFVESMRISNHVLPPDEILLLLENLSIHRPKYRLISSLITTYANRPSFEYHLSTEEKRNYYLYSVKMFRYFTDKWKFKTNRYIWNTMLGVFHSLSNSIDFWDLYKEYKEELGKDGYTYRVIMNRCIEEGKERELKKYFRLYRQNREKLKKNWKLDREIHQIFENGKIEIKEQDEKWIRTFTKLWEEDSKKSNESNLWGESYLSSNYEEMRMINKPRSSSFKSSSSSSSSSSLFRSNSLPGGCESNFFNNSFEDRNSLFTFKKSREFIVHN